MTDQRDHSPPQIEGFTHEAVIGHGGFAAVHRYRQHRPQRSVAVKVLHEAPSDRARAMFDVEADLMASLSSHPFIVTLYEAGLTADGRPYLAMEYCSRPGFGARYRTERYSLPEVLRAGVQLAGAVETAHRAGILHRDIKPANVLVTDYGHPALTDFGISVTLDNAGRAEGMSVPWSPPESFGDVPGTGVGTDVWALGATLYTLLAQRSPFEVPGGTNTISAVERRILLDPLPPTGRSDVPHELELVLATAMAKAPGSRWPSALDLARALQKIEAAQSLPVTTADVVQERAVPQRVEPAPDRADDAPRTRQTTHGGGRSAGTSAGRGGIVPLAAVTGVTSPASNRLLALARRRAIGSPAPRPDAMDAAETTMVRGVRRGDGDR